MLRSLVLVSAVTLAAAGGRADAQQSPRSVPPPAPHQVGPDDARSILARYVQAWRGSGEMRLADTTTLSFLISGDGGGSFHVVLPPDGSAVLRDGTAGGATISFETDLSFLRRLDRGELNALTAMGQARSIDPVPLRMTFPEGFRWTPEASATVLPLVFHFWTRGSPETLRFGDGTTRLVHGGNVAVIYYDRGLRTAWCQLLPGIHINADPADQVNPFATLVIVTRGQARSRIGGVERILREGEAVLVTAGTAHEVWTGPGDYAECILVMFGPGA